MKRANNKHNMPAKPESGFSLVELAIALTVIGLILAGLSKGSELISNARIDRLAMDFTETSAAMENFKRMYKALPGDMRYAGNRLSECDSAPCNGNGNGDNAIGSDNPYSNANYPATSESRAFWVQLSRAGLLSSVQGDYTGTPNSPGIDFPRTPFGGGYRVFNNSYTSGFPRVNENMIRPSRELNNSAITYMFTAAQVARLDRKIDDGLPETGKILGIRSGSGNTCNTTASGPYPETSNTKCNILYILGR